IRDRNVTGVQTCALPIFEQAHRAGEIVSIDAVRDELLAGDDELAEWARARRDFFLPIDHLTVPYFASLSTWASSRNYTPAALQRSEARRVGNDVLPRGWT